MDVFRETRLIDAVVSSLHKAQAWLYTALLF